MMNFQKDYRGKVYSYINQIWKGIKLGAFILQFKSYLYIQNRNILYTKKSMLTPELQRIRLLENRMRKKTKHPITNNDQSLKSIKSTDSKKAHHHHPAKQQKISDLQVLQPSQESQSEPIFNMLSEEEMKKNKKITDYFSFKPRVVKRSVYQGEKECKQEEEKKQKQDDQQKQKQDNEIIVENSQKDDKKQESHIGAHEKDSYQEQLNDLMKSHSHSQPDAFDAFSNPRPKHYDKSEYDSLKQQNRLLIQKLRLKQELLSNCKTQMLDYVIKCHKMKRNQMRQRVSNNKIRLGEYIPDKKGKDIWIDGTQIRQIKEKIQNINKEKDQLEKLKKQSKKMNKDYQEDPEEWKNSIASQTYFLTRQQTHYQEILKRLDEQKMLHIKQYKLLFEEQHSKYGKINPETGVSNWIKIKKYQLLGLLGKGGFSEVYKAFDVEEMRQTACKIHQFHSNWNSTAKENYIKHALRENAVHKALCHPNIVKLYDTVEIDNNSFCTVLEYCEGPDLSYYLKKHKKIPEKQAKMIIKQVINAIRYLHSLPDKVIHYDLKPQNIMFHKGKIKITDFGLCKTTKEDVIELTSQGVGTYWYLPPQCFETSKKAVITPKVDIWSIGVVYYEMLFGEKPFGDKMSQMRILNEGIMLKATQVNFPVNQKNTVSNESKQFIKDCLKPNVEDRIDIWAAANHKLFEKR